MSKEQDQIFFRNFSLALGGIALLMVLFFVIAQYAASDDEADANMRAAKVAEVTEPVGQVTAVGAGVVVKAEVEEVVEEMVVETSVDASAGGEASDNLGKTVFDGLCFGCHGQAVMAAMIPQAGDAAAWGPRIEKGIETLYDHALNGFTGDMGMMPAKGGNLALSDDEIKAAVDYIVSRVQ